MSCSLVPMVIDENTMTSQSVYQFIIYLLSFIVDMVDCGVPMDNRNSTINFTSTTLGSIATYQCRDNVQTVHCIYRGWSIKHHLQYKPVYNKQPDGCVLQILHKQYMSV